MSQQYFNDSDVIKSVMDFNYTGDCTAEPFIIAYGIDKNFLYGCGISIASILLTNPGVPLEFHVFTDFFSDEDRSRFEALAKQYGTRIVVSMIDCEKLKSLPSTRNWTYATYFRFIIADHFAGKTEKVLYLDADIACQGSIQELVDLRFTDEEIAAVVVEGNTNWWQKRAVSLDTPGLKNGYFNAGFLLMNIEKWAEEGISTKAINMLRDPAVVSKITHLDQDVLNMLLVGKARYVDKKFNTQFSINYELKEQVVNPVDDSTVFIHYIGPTKPWHVWATYPVSHAFLNAKQHSPWQRDALLSPANANQWRYAAKHYFKQKKYLAGVSGYLNYFMHKVK